MNDALENLANSRLAIYLAENPDIFPWAETLHVMAIGLVFGTILIVDLRLLNIASRSLRVSTLTRGLLPITWIAFGGAILTGLTMFLTNPVGYLGNAPFQIKLAMLLAAGFNMAVFHLLTSRGMAAWDMPDARPPKAARVAGLLSICIWLTVIAAGRWIGFTINAF